MTGNSYKGLLTVAVFLVAIAGVIYLFRDFAESYTESTAPQAEDIGTESRDACLERTERRREYIKTQRDDIEQKQRALERGEMETQNEAHRDYLEKFYADTLQELNDEYDELIHETCDAGE